jgi:drug/metabolite transporter (DMT)-like permease
MTDAPPLLKRAVPGIFVLLWSTGFIAAKYGLPYASPFAFLLVRFVLAALVLLTLALAVRAAWPRSPRAYADLALAGALVQGVYLGGVFFALSRGMSAGTAAVLVGLQPLVTVGIARAWLRERVTSSQWIGLCLGLAGVVFIVHGKVSFAGDVLALVAAALALLGISIGTVYQKRRCADVDIRTGSAIQFATSALLYVPLAWLEHGAIRWSGSFVFALAWSVFVLSCGAISLLYWLLRHGAASDVARLFFLVPPVTALMAYALFGERLDALALAGMALVAIGVALASRR